MSNGLQPWLPAQDSPEIAVNENFEALSHMATFAKDPTATEGLTWGFLGGRWGGHLVAAGALTLPASSTCYVVASRATGEVSVSTTTGSWMATDAYARCYKLTTGVSTVTVVEDHRAGFAGVHGISSLPVGGEGGSGAAPVVLEENSLRTAGLSDAGCYLRFVAIGAKSCEFLSTSGFSSGQEIHITNRAASGDLTLSPSGITMSVPKGGTLTLEPGDTVTVKFTSTTNADVFGSTKGAA